MSDQAQETRPLIEWLASNRAAKVIRKRRRNRVTARAYAQKYYAANKDMFVHRATVRANRMRELVADLTEADWSEAITYFGGCAYCGAAGPWQKEHVHPASKGGGLTRRNIVPACVGCNQSKKDSLLHEWYRFTEFYSDASLFLLVGWIYGREGQDEVRAMGYVA